MKVLGWVAMLAAVVGIVIGLVAAVGVWVVRPELQDRAEELVLTADAGLARSAELLDQADAAVVLATDAVTKLNATAQSVAANPVIDETTRASLASGIEGFLTGPYADIQASYAGLQERVQSVGRTLGLIDRLLPGVELPGNVADTLTDIDAAVQQLDGTITGGAGLLTETLTGPNASSRIAEQTQRLEDALVLVSAALPRVDEAVTAAQARVATALSQVDSWFNLSAVVVTLIGLYLAGLNVLLWQKGRQWAGRAGASTAPAA